MAWLDTNRPGRGRLALAAAVGVNTASIPQAYCGLFTSRFGWRGLEALLAVLPGIHRVRRIRTWRSVGS
ncbi:MAG: hypothetical protein ACREPI_06935 [Candidatus Dormibacterales bacterium]